jgi:hypothetical protein
MKWTWHFDWQLNYIGAGTLLEEAGGGTVCEG